jgi:hypothetical protein
MYPNSSFYFFYVHLELTFELIKELGNASNFVKGDFGYELGAFQMCMMAEV